LCSTTTCFCLGFILVLKHILHIIILKIIYDLMSITINMTRISHKPLYFNLLSYNFRNCKNRVFLPFDFTCFNIKICLVTICTNISIFLELFEVFELISFYYSKVLTNYVWPLLHKFLLHKRKLFPYVAKKFLSSYLLLLHVDMVVIQI
jgi:hypothetical protein